MGRPVIVRSAQSFRTEVEVGPHRFVADEPEPAGGRDLGPSPYDLLASALGTCKSMTLHFYATREHLPLEGVEVTVEHGRVHATDCADCMSGNGFIHQFTVRIRLTGPLDQTQRSKLLQIAGRCPVARTLGNEIAIRDILDE